MGTVFILFYKPSSPFPHDYLDHPLRMMSAVLLAVCCGLVLRAPGQAYTLRCAAIFAICGLGIAPNPLFVDVRGSAQIVCAGGPAAPGLQAPAGYCTHRGIQGAAYYRWDDYQAMLNYLRTSTPPETKVANLLMHGTAVAGPAGRLSVFHAESLSWLVMVRPNDLGLFLDDLKSTNASIVVWSPGATSSEGPAARLKISCAGYLNRKLASERSKFGDANRVLDTIPTAERASLGLNGEANAGNLRIWTDFVSLCFAGFVTFCPIGWDGLRRASPESAPRQKGSCYASPPYDGENPARCGRDELFSAASGRWKCRAPANPGPPVKAPSRVVPDSQPNSEMRIPGEAVARADEIPVVPVPPIPLGQAKVARPPQPQPEIKQVSTMPTPPSSSKLPAPPPLLPTPPAFVRPVANEYDPFHRAGPG